MTLKPDCASRFCFLDAAISALLVATVWHPATNARIVMALTRLVSVTSFFTFTVYRCLPIPHGRSAHWPKPTELLDFDVVGSRRRSYPSSRWETRRTIFRCNERPSTCPGLVQRSPVVAWGW